MTQAFALHLYDGRNIFKEDESEFHRLIRAAGYDVTRCENRRLVRMDAGHYIGRGLLEDVESSKAECRVLILNRELSPIQQRNLEKALGITVVSFTDLVIGIFADRARSLEGKLQVELARLQYQAGRLVRGWTHLQRQRGGLGWRGGQGETQIEVDRRQLRTRIKTTRVRLEKFQRQREQGRKARGRAGVLTVALVGYTNAGKTTLFNTLARSDGFAADMLFATLDPLFRRVYLPDFGPILLVDTVGFIKRLPHALVEAFKATLQETAEADLLLHVIDFSDPRYAEHIDAVRQTLHEIGADTVPCLHVFNKIDCVQTSPPHAAGHDEAAVYISALDTSSLDPLKQRIGTLLSESAKPNTVIDPTPRFD